MMENIYFIDNNKIVIVAQGSSKNNRIKNDLIWEVNQLLEQKYKLYTIYISSNTLPEEYTSFYIRAKSLRPKYVILQKMDRMFVDKTTIDEKEAEKLHKAIDPKMDFDVFKESMCVENVDMEYIAVSDLKK